mgnify:CR=1 FL=1
MSLSARRAWIEIKYVVKDSDFAGVALRKESVDRNRYLDNIEITQANVALRKESVDRNQMGRNGQSIEHVALRKESVDRNAEDWLNAGFLPVALRKESVDRNLDTVQIVIVVMRRSPQGERG